MGTSRRPGRLITIFTKSPQDAQLSLVCRGWDADIGGMDALPKRLDRNRKLMAYTAAAIYGGAALDGAIESVLPRGPSFAITPVIVAAVIVIALLIGGPSLPAGRWLCSDRSASF